MAETNVTSGRMGLIKTRAADYIRDELNGEAGNAITAKVTEI